VRRLDAALVMKATASLFLLLLTAAPLLAEGLAVNSNAALKAALRAAAPGSRIVLAPGRYQGNCKIVGVNGKPDAFVEIAAKDPTNPPVFQGSAVGFQLIRSSYFVLDGIVCEKARVNNVQTDFCHHFIVKNVHSRDIAGTSNCDGIKMPGCTDFLLHKCVVEKWGGEGSAIDMVGCARGLVMKCRFAYPDLRGQTANGIQPKGGTHSMGFYQCRFEDASLRALQFGGSTGSQYFFQGNRETGYEGLDMVAMGNVFTSGGAAIAFVSCTNCVAEYNTIVNPRKFILRILKEGGTRPTARNTFAHNLVVYGKLAQVVNIGGGADPTSFTFAENYWHNTLNPARSIPRLPAQERSPAGGQDPRLDTEFRPAEDSPAKDCGAHAPGLATAWAKHTGKFKWAWEQAQKLEAR
jgi:hypothetical protein